jgi:hypothetical protein
VTWQREASLDQARRAACVSWSTGRARRRWRAAVEVIAQSGSLQEYRHALTPRSLSRRIPDA